MQDKDGKSAGSGDWTFYLEVNAATVSEIFV